MSVYEHAYRPYSGERTAPRWRFLVLARYALSDTFRSRWFIALFALCFGPPFFGLLAIYLVHNLAALKLPAQITQGLASTLTIDAQFFWLGLWIQGVAAALVALIVGPALIAPDLRNNGLALYLARPLSRAEYVAGKLAVLAYLLSLVTWVPGLLLFAFQSFLEPGWILGHLRLAGAVFAGSVAEILVLSLLALAVSAWVKWRPLARIALMAIFFVLMGFAGAINAALETRWAWVLSVWHGLASLWDGLFGIASNSSLPFAVACAQLTAVALLCLWLLARRIRAYEVVR